MIVTCEPSAPALGERDEMTGPRNAVVVGTTVGRVRTVVVVLEAAVVAKVVEGSTLLVVVGCAVVVVALAVMDVGGDEGVEGAGAVGKSNGVAVSCTAEGVHPVTATVPPSAAALDDTGQASHAIPPATSAVTTPMPTIVLRCRWPSRHVVRAKVPPGGSRGLDPGLPNAFQRNGRWPIHAVFIQLPSRSRRQ
jgi:hypothetical protein